MSIYAQGVVPPTNPAPTPARPTHLRARFAKDASNVFFADARRQVSEYLRQTGNGRYDDGRIARKGTLYAAVTLCAYLLALFGGLPPWASFAAGVVFGLGSLMLGLNVGHDGAHNCLTRRRSGILTGRSQCASSWPL